MKKVRWFLAVAAVLSLESPILAGQQLPVIVPPTGFEEGTQTQLSASQLAEILPWAMNSEIALKELQDSVRIMSPLRSKQALEQGIRRIVTASTPKQTEILMRYILNRALKISEEIEKETDTRLPGVLAQQVRVLKLSVAMALKYYQSDIEFLNGQVTHTSEALTPPFARFAVEYARFLLSIDNSLIFARAQYNIAVIALGLLQWDLYRDEYKVLYSPAIGKIQSTLASVPERASGSDEEIVNQLRLVKKGLLRAIDLAVDIDSKPHPDLPIGLGSITEADVREAVSRVNAQWLNQGPYDPFFQAQYSSSGCWGRALSGPSTRLEDFEKPDDGLLTHQFLQGGFRTRKEKVLDALADILFEKLKSDRDPLSKQYVRSKVNRLTRFSGQTKFEGRCSESDRVARVEIWFEPGTLVLEYARN